MDPAAKVIIAAADESSREALYQSLHQLGYVVNTAYSKQDVLYLLRDRSQTFRAVFADVTGGSLSGLKIMNDIRTGLNNWKTLVFLVTDADDEGTKRATHEFEVAGLITKPFTCADIARAIKEAVPF